MKNKSLIFLILSSVMYFTSIFWGDVLNQLYVGANTRLYYYSNNVDFSFLKNISAGTLTFLNIFFAILFAIFLAISVFMSIKENKK